jgi:hypothetical protein
MTDTQTATRTFHASDYRKTARLIQSMRHVKGNRYQPKPQADQDKIDGIVLMWAAIFEEDAASAPGAPFSKDYFVAGTQLPQAPAFDANPYANGPLADDTDEDDQQGDGLL